MMISWALSLTTKEITLNTNETTATNSYAYLGATIKANPLLSRQQMLALSKQQQLGVAAAKQLQELAADDESRPSLQLLVDQGKEARDKIILANQRLVVYHAHQYQSKTGAEPDDLVGDGIIGLISAVDRFNPERGTQLSTVAYPWVSQEMSKGLTKQSQVVRLTAKDAQVKRNLPYLQQQLETELGRSPTDRELAARAGTSLKTLQILQNVSQPRSLDQPAWEGSENPESLYNSIIDSDSQNDPEAAALQKEQRLVVQQALAQLSERELRIITARLGLQDTKASLSAVAAQENISRERVRQIETKVMSKLRLSCAGVAPNGWQPELSKVEEQAKQVQSVSNHKATAKQTKSTLSLANNPTNSNLLILNLDQYIEVSNAT